MATFISRSAEETMALGQCWGQKANSGWVIGLSGDLGAGKTQLVKGIAQGLGVTDRVHSPTFVLVNAYHGGRLPLFHLDLYRLTSREQIVAAGLAEYLDQPTGVVVVEWAERWFAEGHAARRHVSDSAPRMLQVNIESLSECERLITYEDPGA